MKYLLFKSHNIGGVCANDNTFAQIIMDVRLKNFHQLQIELIYQNKISIEPLTDKDIDTLLSIFKFLYSQMVNNKYQSIIVKRFFKSSPLYEYLLSVKDKYSANQLTDFSKLSVQDVKQNIEQDIDAFMNSMKDDTLDEDDDTSITEDVPNYDINELIKLYSQYNAPHFNMDMIYLLTNIYDVCDVIPNITSKMVYNLINKVKLIEGESFENTIMNDELITTLYDTFGNISEYYQIVYNQFDTSHKIVKLFDSTLYGVIVCDNVIVDYRNLFDFEYWNALNLREYDFSKYEFYIFIEFDIPIEIFDINYNIIFLNQYNIFEYQSDSIYKMLNEYFKNVKSQFSSEEYELLKSIDNYLTLSKRKG